MKFVRSLIVLSVLSFSQVFYGQEAASGQDSEVPAAVAGVVGSSYASLGFLAQLALGELVESDVSTLDNVKSALYMVGGTKGALTSSNDYLKESLPHFSGAEKASVMELSSMLDQILAQADALIEYLRAKGNGQSGDAEKAQFRKLRAEAAETLIGFGYTLQLVE